MSSCMKSTKDELLAKAKSQKLKVSTKLTKQQLCDLFLESGGTKAEKKSSASREQTRSKSRTSSPVTSLQWELKDSSSFINNITVIKKLTEKLPKCSTVHDAEKHLYGFPVNKQEFTSILSSSFDPKIVFDAKDDAANQLYLQCYVHDVFKRVESMKLVDPNDSIQWLSNSIKEYFDLKKISKKSSNGIVWLVSDKSVNGPIFGVMKSTKPKAHAEENGELIHELAVGYVLNLLRSKIPNFTYTYSGFWCDMNQTGDTVKCSENPKVHSTTLTIQEAITSGKGLNDWIEWAVAQLQVDQIKLNLSQILIQVAHALYIAEKEFKYVHFDLHDENVMIRELKAPIDLHLKTDKYDVKLKAVRFLPMIIDYGMNACEYKGIVLHNRFYHQGSSDAEMHEIGSTKDFYYPSFDMFKLVFHTIDDMYDRSSSRKSHQVIEELYPKLWALFRKQANKVSTHNKIGRDFKQFLLATDLEEWNDLATPENQYVNIQNKAVFKADSGDWIQQFIE